MPERDSQLERFRQNEDVYKSESYLETRVRVEFIDPFFHALGWDIRNEKDYAEQYKDVVHEDTVKVGGFLRAPDYSFRIGGQRKFFLEAKKPAVNIKSDINPAYQLRRYAWSAKLPLSILTDFEELAVYDCRIRPNEKDKASAGRVALYSYTEYLEKFDEIYDRFSREAVLKGSFDRYVESAKLKKGTAEVDSAFLGLIDAWRDELARYMAIRNMGLDTDELNFAVQHTIDRVIFLRICEDRGIEDYGRLQAMLNGANIYSRLLGHFYAAADKYNSGLFDFKADSLSETLQIDDRVLKNIIDDLYPPKSPYEFSVIGADILGNVYEQFLGKVIRLTAGHQAKVEEKPEVKKAGGVFYTPGYIVDYIVKETLGRALEGKTPAQASKLKVLDPACGSGSFLIGAYQYLLDWHTEWYAKNDPEKYARGKTPAVFQGRGGWRLSTGERKRILLNNIFGVDIDRQAVEVTKLSLLLKVLEGENQETVKKNLSLFNERALPNIDENIKCGNSLIGPDFYSQMDLLDGGDARRINVFDWNDDKRGFGRIMKDGGFDVVIGNPPYVRQEMLGEFKPYFERQYSAYHGVADLYVYFIEQSHRLLRNDGLFGFICSNKFMRSNYGKPIRGFLAGKSRIRKIVDFGELPVFQDAATFPAIILTENSPSKKQRFIYAPVKRLDFKSLEEEVRDIGEGLDNRSLSGENWTLAGKDEIAVFEKMKKLGVPLGRYIGGEIYRGVLTGLNEAFVIDRDIRDRLVKEDRKSAELIKPFVVGDDIRKYCVNSKEKSLILMPRGWTRARSGHAREGDAWQWLCKRYPAIAEHLKPFNAAASKRHDKGEFWWELRACDYYPEFEKPKIVFPDIAKSSRFSFDANSLYVANTGYIIPLNDLYLLGLLNSKLIFAYFKRNSSVLGDADKGGRLRWIRQDVEKIPIRAIDQKEPKEKSVHSEIISLAKRLLDLNEKLKKAKTPHDRELIERQIGAADRQIDSLVYGLYGLTPEEIAVVEQGA
ncbi:MAG: Eco57I restriction-modification methylase domain-containing protein [Deltaproteobacteria bacterium]|nr:Eco57I restriction-modification methylase domain-containing protein [Deltaproteobacteria bacterium]